MNRIMIWSVRIIIYTNESNTHIRMISRYFMRKGKSASLFFLEGSALTFFFEKDTKKVTHIRSTSGLPGLRHTERTVDRAAEVKPS